MRIIKFLLLLLVLTKNSYGQKQADTLCLPTDKVRGLVIAAKQGDVLKEQVTLLNTRISLLQSTIKELEAKDSVTTAACLDQIANLNQQKALYTDQLNTYEKLLKRERRKRRLIQATGIAVAGVVGYLYLTK